MIFKFKKDNRGLIKWIFIIIIAIIILSYLGFDLRAIVEAEGTQNNLNYVWGGVVMIWNNYLSDPILYFWNNIFLNLIWSAFVENMEIIGNGGPIINPDLIPELP